GGDYYESLDFSSIKNGSKIRILNKESERVRIVGSDVLEGWSSEGNNVYSTDYNGTIKNWERYFGGMRLIFEDGNPSKEINNLDRLPQQKNNKYRLPFTVIKEVGSISECQANPGSFYYDEDKLYLHTSNSDNPNSNG